MRQILLLTSLLIAISIPRSVSAQPAISSEIASLGKLRLAMNAGNPLCPEHSTTRSSVALPKGRSSAAQGKFAEIVNEAKRTGIVQKAIEQAGLRGVRVAPD